MAGASVTALNHGWQLLLTDHAACANPEEALIAEGWIPAPVPGTVAEALELQGEFDRAQPEALDSKDAWYVLEFHGEPGEAVLRFDGLATRGEVFLNGQSLLTFGSMFETHDVPVFLTGADKLGICFRALRPHLERQGPRARWRPRLISHQGLRLVRTTLLGYMPGWCPEIHAIGPYRAISLMLPDKVAVSDLNVISGLVGSSTGHLQVRFRISGADHVRVYCHGREVAAERQPDGSFRASLHVPDIEPWFPHTHGQPVLYDFGMRTETQDIHLGRTGFRRLSVDRGADGRGFGILVNDIPVFCRGAVWTTADIVRLPGEEADYRPLLELAVAAGMNMIRIGGTMAYESPAFFRICDELGILVWQDLMFANFDYPVKDPAFLAHVEREVTDQLSCISASPSLAIVCGGSEMHQQGAMLGLPRSVWEGLLTTEILPELVARYRCDVPYVANSPTGGAMPFAPNEGITHYYGVGAYERPLEDARRAEVRFSSESLAFAQVPQQRVLDAHLPVPAVHDPRWKSRVPRDRDASWDFEDTRDHYLRELYGFDPERLRREDPVRYLDFSRAVTGEVSEAVFAEWRRVGSICRGGLVWTLRDLLPGAGWGVIDATGEPKPVYYALARAFRPVQILLTDEGTNGLDVHVINEKPDALEVFIELACLRDGSQPIVSGKKQISLAARDSLRLAATDLFGVFFDTNYAFRFGPPSHDVTVARLRLAGSEEVLAEAFHFPLGRAVALHTSDIEAGLVQDEGGWSLVLGTDRMAQSVSIESPGHRAAEDWFHLCPGVRKTVRLSPLPGTDPTALPSGTIRSLGSRRTFSF